MKKFFFCILKVTEERSQIWSWILFQSWIQIHLSEVHIRGSRSAPKCHESPTLTNSFCVLSSTRKEVRVDVAQVPLNWKAAGVSLGVIFITAVVAFPAFCLTRYRERPQLAGQA